MWILTSAKVVWTGSLKATFGPSSKLTWFEFADAKHEEYLKRSDIEKLFSPDSPNNQKTSPKVNNKAGSKLKNGKVVQNQPATITLSELPQSPIGSLGVSKPFQEFLEVSNRLPRRQRYPLTFYRK